MFTETDRSDARERLRQYRHEDRIGAIAATVFGVLLLATIGSFVYIFGGGERTFASRDLRPPITQPSTTGVAPAPESAGS